MTEDHAAPGRRPGEDTTDDARAVQRAAWERLGPTGRLRQVIELSDVMHRVALAGIASRHPELDERGVILRYIKDVHGVDLDTAG